MSRMQGAGVLDRFRYYKTIDPIEHFRVRVSFVHTSGNLCDRLDRDLETNHAGTAHVRTEVLVADWQQKIYSPSEIVRYAALADAPLASESLRPEAWTYIQTRRNQPESREASVLKNGLRRQGMMLFTRINSELVSSADVALTPAKSGPKAPRLQIPHLHADPIIHPPSVAHRVQSHLAAKPIYARENEELNPEEASPLLTGTITEMQLCVFVPIERPGSDPAIEPRPEFDYVERKLCVIRYHSSGHLGITASIIHGETYHFLVENVSNTPSPADVKKESALFQEYISAQLMAKEQAIGPLDDSPMKAPTDQLIILGELVSLTGFPVSLGVWAQYWFELADPWMFEPESTVSGRTQLCTSSVPHPVTGDPCLHLGCPFELSCSSTAPSTTSPSSSSPSSASTHSALDKKDVASSLPLRGPRVYVQVHGLDWKGDNRVLGYTSFQIPIEPGMTTYALPTWKLQESLWQRMNNFFLPPQQLDRVANYVGIPQGMNSSKLGMATENAGTVHLRVSVMYRKRTTDPVLVTAPAHSFNTHELYTARSTSGSVL
ncbi:hypothetical protein CAUPRSCDRAFT_10208 [Caulochytrium protostelioides]|uniref:Uncharacterized protein n=1 Tax=Caulochytrium protostelioides TaxID=1555241 RepID=A0A4P9WZZ5_9FUNG|nr:hypothetical protein CAUPRSCDRAFT_10208 [Caulochytrium protostelioides]